ncbi:hypothetical protein [Kangiella shandongensis]|uniref:hypothetical protein n=1 Tax=Kangiella shandongensis TaxID=2763258 RepID=UPI001CC008AF|nr:hypothetical protein [Kangiella shandongensis]
MAKSMEKTISAKLVVQQQLKAHNDFVQTVGNYLEEFFPGTHDYFDTKQINDTIELGIEKAHSHGIYGKNDICSFVCLMFTFLGNHFDVDPLYPWTQTILAKKNSPQQPTITASEKVALLWEKQQQLNANIFGPNSEYLNQVFKTFRSHALLAPFDDIQRPLKERIIKRLSMYYPDKYRQMDTQSVSNMIDEGFALCGNYNVNAENEICWYISLMFVLGSRFDIDPKYPVLSYLQEKKNLKNGELTEQLKLMVKHYLKSKLDSIRQLQNSTQKEIA